MYICLVINQINHSFMKKLSYLFVAAIMFAFTACGGGASEEAVTEEAVTEEAVTEEAAEEATEETAN